MLKSFIGADMRLYERFGVGLHNNPDNEVIRQVICSVQEASKP